ncbi:hypothetical protein [Nannocystis pusilla]|uniref:hypothetical protein n=1 Tax=Nannocystis pusilla TaxID=889268 RepID=UPI003DA30241
MTTNAASPREVRPPLVREILWETDMTRSLLAVAVPAAVFAWAVDWVFAFVLFEFAAWSVLTMCLGFFRRTLYCFELFEHGIELRDGHGAILGETANGTLRVVRCNVQMRRQMESGVRLEHHGGTFLLLPNPALAPWPGMPAVPWAPPYVLIAGAAYQRVLALAE